MSLRPCIIIILLLSLFVASARAQSGPQTTQAVVAGGGGTSASGQSLQVEGTAGQSVTGASQGGTFKLESGFWAGAAAQAVSNLSVDNLTAVYGGSVNLKATLSATGANISGKVISFSLNGTNVGTATTDAQGLAILNNVSLSGINAGIYATGISAEISSGVELTAANGVGQLTVLKADPLLSVTGGNFTYDGQPHPATASATGVNNEALGPISLLYNGTNSIPVDAGSYAVTAAFAGNQNYNPATNNQQSIIISTADQTITFLALPDKTFGNADFTVNATASSGLAVSFTATGNCTSTGNTVHVTGAGLCTVTASQIGDGNYKAAAAVAQSFNITKAPSTTSIISSNNPSNVGQSVTFTATVESGAGTPTGSVQFQVDGTNSGAPVALNGSGVAAFSLNSLTAGAHTITASYDGDTNFIVSNGTLAGGQQVNIQTSITINDVQVSEGASGTTNAVFTVTLAEASNLTAHVDFSTADSTAKAGTDYQASSGTLTFAPGELTKTITVTVNGNTINEPNKTFFVNLTNPQHATLSDAQGTGTIINDDAASLQLSSNGYSVDEGAGHATITVTRTGDISGAASVQFATSDLAGLTNCNINIGNASPRCDFTAVAGTLNFIAGQASATFDIPIINDVYVEGPETLPITLSNSTGGNLGTLSTATLTITDNDFAPGAPNPIDDPSFFVRLQYMDILNREPEAQGLTDWLSILQNCPQGDTSCDLVEVSSGFFRSPEFFDRVYYIYRFYEVGLGRKPGYVEYQRDIKLVTGFLTPAELEARKQQFAYEFSQRADFRARYDQYDSATHSQQYVDALAQTAEVMLSNRLQLNYELANSIKQRWDVLRAIVEGPEVSQKFFNKAFVVIGYFAYLRRDPDAQYQVWLDKLNNPPAGKTERESYREMIGGFIFSQEYRSRFGQ
ncbi:MAG TPA: Calx-beta domain-containing protein [Pyrinomonadaceae bacterium]|jgi:hypothetical protein|nr:Calx-beta domain-containing protein [Pyrinomonadaceae bacterium]